MVAATMVIFVDNDCYRGKQQLDGGIMTQWHPQQWRLCQMMATAMVVVVINCAAADDAATTFTSLALMVAAKTPSPLPPSTAASINNDCYCCRQQPTSPLPYSQQLQAAAVCVDGNSNGEGRRG
jgi:hypothetical protein